MCTKIVLFRGLSETHTGFDDVDDVVGEFLTLVDEVHIDGADGIGVFVVVHVGDVLRLQLVAIVVDLMLNIERAVDIE